MKARIHWKIKMPGAGFWVPNARSPEVPRSRFLVQGSTFWFVVPGVNLNLEPGTGNREPGTDSSSVPRAECENFRTHRPRTLWGAVGRVAASTICLLVLSSCTELLTQHRSSSILLIERIANGANEQGYLASDVLTCQSGGQNCTVVEDIARITTRVALKDPGTAENAASPSPANYITITRYRVVYRREDGRNTPGVDVPYPWDGGTTFTTVSGIQTNDFVIVRAAAKIEPPLLALRGGGGATYIGTIAEITFYGHDQAGQSVLAKGTMQVDFADWGP